MSKRIPQTFIQDVIARTDIVELIKARVKINNKGQNYLGLCPFHNEKSPSFTVSPQKQFYYCFGCGAHGNAIGFLMAFDRMEFLDAVLDLAAKQGLEIPEEHSAEVSLDADFAFLKEVNQFYLQQLRQSNAAIQYLKSRGLTGQIAKHFQIGFAPNQWDSLLQHCTQQIEELKRHGLLIQKEDKKSSYDRFRNRVMFPIRDYRGRIIAFGGRTIADDSPKYLNSPETILFHKSQELYGLYEVLQYSHHPTSIIIVEGYMDVIALHQYGIQNAVATLGTATNPKHLQKLFRYTNEVVFCFDGDNAGRQAAWKALTVNLPLIRDGVQVRFMFLPPNDDPDSLIRRVGVEGFQQRLQQAKALSVVFFELIRQEIPLDTPDAKALYATKATQYLNTIPKGIFRELMFGQLAKELNVYVSDLPHFQAEPTHTAKLPQKNKVLMSPVHQACALLLQEPKLCHEVSDLTQLAEMSLPDMPLLIKIWKLLKAESLLSIGQLLLHFSEETDKQLIAELAARRLPFTTDAILMEFQGAIARLLEQNIELEIAQLIEKLKIQTLSDEEKKRLTQLLTQRHKTPI